FPSRLINPFRSAFSISGVDALMSEKLPKCPLLSRLTPAVKMLHTNKVLGAFAGLGLATATSAAEGTGVAPAAAQMIDFGNGWAITNSMVTGWSISLLLILVVIALVRRPKIFPTKGQAVFESLLEALRDLFEPIVGKRAFPAAFPVLITLFIFILFHNW